MTYISFKICGFDDKFNRLSICGEKLAEYLSSNFSLEYGVIDAGYFIKYKDHLLLIGSDINKDEWFLRAIKDSPFSSDPNLIIINEIAALLRKNHDITNVVIGE